MNQNYNSPYPIGVFDSGLGGLTVLQAIQKVLPKEDIIYFGDTARVPYGNRSQSIIIEYAKEIVDFLMKHNAKCIVIACNTASAYTLDFLKDYCSIPVYGVVEPAVSFVVQNYSNISKISVIATKSTIQSNIYQKVFLEKESNIDLYQKACPLLVPIIEEGMYDSYIAKEVIKIYLDSVISNNIMHIILGCTHYPLLKKTMLSLYPKIQLIDSSITIANQLRIELDKKNLLKTIILNDKNQQFSDGTISLFVSDITDHLIQFKNMFFKNYNCKLEKVVL